MRQWLFAIACVLIGGTAVAGPFLRLRSTCPPQGCAPPLVRETPSPTFTTPSPESKPEAIPAPQPWLLNSPTEDFSSLQPDTVLEPVEGTGSKSPTGPLGILPKIPGTVNHSIDPATLDKVKEILSQKPQPVTIGPVLDQETSQRLSRILMVSEWLLWLAGGIFGGSAVGKVLPLVARVVDGLRSAIPAPSPVVSPTPAAPSSSPPST